MSRHGDKEHELLIGSSTETFRLMRDENGAAMYKVDHQILPYRNPLKIVQTNWIDGHGQYSLPSDQAQNGTNESYFDGQSIDTTIDGVVFLGPLINVVKDDSSPLDSEPVGFFWAETVGKWLCFTAGKVYIYDGTDWDAATTTLTRVKQIVEYDGVLYAARSQATPGTWAAGDEYYTSTDGSTWTVTNLTDCYANRFLTAPNSAGTANVLWKARTPNEVTNTTNGQAGGTQWASPTFVGDTTHNITNLFLIGDKLKVGREDNEYYMDSAGGVHPERDDLKENQSTNNFKYVTTWQTSVYHSEERGMGEITIRDTYDPMGPLFGKDNIGKVGDVVGISGDKNWLYVAVDEGTYTHIYKGREVRKNSRLMWQWCPWVYLGAYTCQAIGVCQHTTIDRRLWFGYTNPTGNVYGTGYVILSDNPLVDSLARFTTSGFLRLSYDYGTNAKNDKLYQSVVVDVAGADTGETWQIKYRKDTDTSMSNATSSTPYITNGIQEKTFSSALSCNRIQFEIDLASDTSTATPQVRYIELKGIEKPEIVRVHEAVYMIGDQPTDRAKTLRDLFRTARSSTTLIKFADLRFNGTTGGTAGTDYVYCAMEPGYPQEVEILHTKDRQPELGIKVRMREVNYS